MERFVTESINEAPQATSMENANALGFDGDGKLVQYPVADMLRSRKDIAYPETIPDGDRFVGETWPVDTDSYGAVFPGFGNQTVPEEIEVGGVTKYVSDARFVWSAGQWNLQFRAIDFVSGVATSAELAEKTIAVEYLSDKIGVVSPTSGAAGISNGYTRVDIANPTTQAGHIDIEANVRSNVSGFLKVFSKNGDGTYNVVQSFPVNFINGLNQIKNFAIDANRYIGFYAPSSSVAGVDQSPLQKSIMFNGDISGINLTPAFVSGYLLQFNYRYVQLKEVKDLTSKNSLDIFSLQAQVPNLASKTEVAEVKDAVTIPSSSFFGKSDLSPTSGPSTTSPSVRIEVNPLSGVSQLIPLNAFWMNVRTAGAFKVRFYEKSGSNYTIKKEHSLNASGAGLTKFTLPANFEVNTGWHLGLRYDAPFQATAVVVGPQPSVLVTSGVDDATVTGALSNWDLYYKLDYGTDKTVKVAVEELRANALYVSKTGNDSNIGSIAAPLLTINKALEKALGKPYTRIIVGSGTYRETLADGGFTFETIEILPAQKAVVKIYGSDALTGWSKTSGRNFIYQVSFSGAIATWTRAANPIFEDGNPSGLISSAERHPLQKGLTHRLPFTPVMAQSFVTDLATTLTALDLAPGKYYHDSAAGILYMHAPGSTNPISNGFTYEAPVRDANVGPSITNLMSRPNIKLNRLQFRFVRRAFNFNGYYSLSRKRCTALGVAGGGIVAGGWRDDTTVVYSFMDEAGYCDGDGFNGHYNAYSDFASLDIREGQGLCKYIDFWSHDNFDDGMSHHERHAGTVRGGLAEYNGDRGLVPAQGAQFMVYDVLARKNGQDPGADSGAGFEVVNPVVGGSNGTKATFFNCLSVDNPVSYGVSGDASNMMTLVNCAGRNATIAEFRAQSGGSLVANNCKVTNSDPAKIKVTSGGGVIAVNNDANLT